jgi:hypothetical protein
MRKSDGRNSMGRCGWEIVLMIKYEFSLIGVIQGHYRLAKLSLKNTENSRNFNSHTILNLKENFNHDAIGQITDANPFW